MKEMIVNISPKLKEKLIDEHLSNIALLTGIEKDKLTKMVNENSLYYLFKHTEALELLPEQKERLKAFQASSDFSRLIKREKPKVITGPETIVEIVKPNLQYENQEHLQVALLNVKGDVIKIEDVSSGSITETIANPKDIFQKAIQNSAPSIILIHNHPSGNPTPSLEDKNFTRRCVEAGNLLDIKVLDHIIIGDKGYHSMNAEGTVDFDVQVKKSKTILENKLKNFDINKLRKQSENRPLQR
ncbi:JAB domain-containing protein [Aminipila butyrica]|uniref:JAB domain-containing protein n=1 Tax=Aminipila butyrica TaxID=433296 RepID=A0A858BWH4_9FIRM|nr:JAB domain-containing protein [Aminipila butyrica]QIB69772.1 JAB domain-containing protein [Aminipila butyrica]